VSSHIGGEILALANKHRLTNRGSNRLIVVVALTIWGLLVVQPVTGYVFNASGCRWAGTEPPIGYEFQSVTAGIHDRHLQR
jgi:hypothetical protein